MVFPFVLVGIAVVMGLFGFSVWQLNSLSQTIVSLWPIMAFGIGAWLFYVYTQYRKDEWQQTLQLIQLRMLGKREKNGE